MGVAVEETNSFERAIEREECLGVAEEKYPFSVIICTLEYFFIVSNKKQAQLIFFKPEL